MFVEVKRLSLEEVILLVEKRNCECGEISFLGVLSSSVSKQLSVVKMGGS